MGLGAIYITLSALLHHLLGCCWATVPIGGCGFTLIGHTSCTRALSPVRLDQVYTSILPLTMLIASFCFPGNPSGHVMITLAVLLTCADYVEKRRDTGSKKTLYSNMVTKCSEKNHGTSSRERGWSSLCDADNSLSLLIQNQFKHLVWLLVAVIAVSRLLISSHFVHQIMCGVIVGLMIHTLSGRLFSGGHTGIRWWHALALALLMVVMSLILFHSWTWLGMDPGFSIPLAERYIMHMV